MPKLLFSTPRWLGSTVKSSNTALKFSESGALALARAHMKLRGLLEGMGRPGMRLLDLGARSSMATHWSGGFGLIDLGLRAAGAPDEATDVTGVLAEANAPAAVFSGWLALGSTTEALIRHGADAGPVIQARNLSGKHTTIVQGYALILARIAWRRGSRRVRDER